MRGKALSGNRPPAPPMLSPGRPPALRIYSPAFSPRESVNLSTFLRDSKVLKDALLLISIGY